MMTTITSILKSFSLWIALAVLIVVLSYRHTPLGPVDTGSQITISVQPLGDVRPSFIAETASNLEAQYQARVVIEKPIELPKSAFVNIKSPRYRADSLLKYLLKIKPSSSDYIIGITATDVSTTKYMGMGRIKQPEWKYNDFGIMGLGYRPGRACVISTFRIQRGIKSNAQLSDRLKKLCSHEIGHNLGLKHCKNPNCFMRDAAEKVRTLDLVSDSLCSDCQRKIRTLNQVLFGSL